MSYLKSWHCHLKLLTDSCVVKMVSGRGISQFQAFFIWLSCFSIKFCFFLINWYCWLVAPTYFFHFSKSYWKFFSPILSQGFIQALLIMSVLWRKIEFHQEKSDHEASLLAGGGHKQGGCRECCEPPIAARFFHYWGPFSPTKFFSPPILVPPPSPEFLGWCPPAYQILIENHGGFREEPCWGFRRQSPKMFWHFNVFKAIKWVKLH